MHFYQKHHKKLTIIQQLYMKRQNSPIKIKDYFTNPIHKIKQPAFVQVGFTQFTLNTFVKSFTNRYSSRYISFTAVKQFIKSFTNNSAKLRQTYQQFFYNNFAVTEDGNILLEHFIEFFTKESGKSLEEFDDKALKELFKEMGELTVENIMIRCEEVGVAMTEKEAIKIIKLLNYDARVKQIRSIDQSAFVKAIKESS